MSDDKSVNISSTVSSASLKPLPFLVLELLEFFLEALNL